MAEEKSFQPIYDVSTSVIRVRRCKQYYEVYLNNEHYCTADTLKEALTEAEQLQKLLVAVSGDSTMTPIEIKLK